MHSKVAVKNKSALPPVSTLRPAYLNISLTNRGNANPNRLLSTEFAANTDAA